MKYALFIIPFILSRLIFPTYFSVNVNQIITEQQMAMTYKRLKVPFSLMKTTNHAVSLLRFPDLIIQRKWKILFFLQVRELY